MVYNYEITGGTLHAELLCVICLLLLYVAAQDGRLDEQIIFRDAMITAVQGRTGESDAYVLMLPDNTIIRDNVIVFAGIWLPERLQLKRKNKQDGHLLAVNAP